ncbi:hypothetical protein EJB05_42800, partial [Eragrostis curvula]
MAPERSWLGSEGVWFVVLNAIVVAIAILSRTRPSLASPRLGGVTRRASSAMLHRLRSFNIFSYPSACMSSFFQPDEEGAGNVSQKERDVSVVTSPTIESPSRALVLSPPPAAERAPEAEDEDVDEEGDPNAMSMEEAYAIVLAARLRPESEREEDARQSEVDAKAEEFIRTFKEDLRQQRLNSIFNYTQMLKQRAQGIIRR